MFLLLCFQKWPSGEVDKADDMTITCSRQTLRRWGRVQHQLGAKAMVLLAEVLLKKKSCSQSKQLGTRRRRCLHWHFAASLMDGKYLTRVTPVWVLPLHHTHPYCQGGLTSARAGSTLLLLTFASTQNWLISVLSRNHAVIIVLWR